MRWFPRKRKGPHQGGAPERLSQLQRQILAELLADAQRTRGFVAADHLVLVRALVARGFDKGNVSRSLQGLARKGLVTIDRTPGGQAQSVDLTTEGRRRASPLVGSCD
jgi:DNA-binding MarR family transcriptional regulator